MREGERTNRVRERKRREGGEGGKGRPGGRREEYQVNEGRGKVDDG